MTTHRIRAAATVIAAGALVSGCAGHSSSITHTSASVAAPTTASSWAKSSPEYAALNAVATMRHSPITAFAIYAERTVAGGTLEIAVKDTALLQQVQSDPAGNWPAYSVAIYCYQMVQSAGAWTATNEREVEAAESDGFANPLNYEYGAS